MYDLRCCSSIIKCKNNCKKAVLTPSICDSANTGNRVHPAILSWPSISVSSFIKLPSILLEICSGHESDFRDMLWTKVGRMDTIKKESNSVNTGDRVMVLAFCNSPHGPLSAYQVSLNYLQYFYRYAVDTSLMDSQTDGQSGDYNMLSLRGA